MDGWTDSNGDDIPSDWTPGKPLTPADDWAGSCGCASPDGPSIAKGVVITGRPATISAMPWQITLNDGSSPPNFTIDHYDAAGVLIGNPLSFSGVDGSASFATPVYLSRDPVQQLEAATKQYVDENASGIPDAPIDNQTYGRDNGTWVALPASYMPEAPNTSIRFGRFNSTWQPDAIQTDAAADGNAYGRVNNGWASVLPITGGVITGNLTVNQVLTVQGSNSLVLNAPVTGGSQRAILGMAANVSRWQLMLGNGTAEGANNAGANFSLSAYGVAGAYLGAWLTIARADGATVFNGSGVTIQGGLAVNGLLALASPNNLAIYGGSAGQVLSTNGSGVLSWATPSGGGGIADAPSDGTAYMRSNAAWSSGGVVRNALTVGVASGSVNALIITPGAAASLPAKLDTSTAGSGVQISGAWTAFKSGGQAVLTAQGNGSVIGIGQGIPNFLTFQNNGGGPVLEIMDQTNANASVGSVVQLLNAPTGNPATAIIQADGVSANRSIQLIPAGTGTVQAPTAAPGTATTQIATTAFVAAAVIGDNRIINGDMRIDQRNNGVAGSAINSYTADRWYFQGTQTGKGTWQRSGNTSNAVNGLYNFLTFASSSAYAVVAADVFNFQQRIEADQIADFAWGTANAQPVTLSFWAASTLTGTFGGAISTGSGATRSYPFTYSIPVASTWARIVITIPGDTAAGWTMNGNTEGARLFFDLGTGSTFRAPAGAWAAGNYTGANGTVSVVGTNGATFSLTGVKLEVGSVATPFNRQSMAKSQADCERYYQRWQSSSGQARYGVGVATSATLVAVFMPFITTMRAQPTFTSVAASNFGLSPSAATATAIGANYAGPGMLINVTTTGQVVGQAQMLFSTAAGAFMDLSAEL